MILMMQKCVKEPDGWEDYALPYYAGPPIRGDKRRVEDPRELAEALCKGKVQGHFRLVMRDGTMHQIHVEEVLEYHSVITRLV